MFLLSIGFATTPAVLFFLIRIAKEMKEDFDKKNTSRDLRGSIRYSCQSNLILSLTFGIHCHIIKYMYFDFTEK